MSAPPRPFLRRFTLALLGMLLVMVLGFAGLGWMVWSRNGLLDRFLSEKTQNRLFRTYAHTAAWLMPLDADGDGFSDGIELFFGSDPHSEALLPPLEIEMLNERPGSVFCGEWVHTRWAVRYEGEQFPLPRGFQGNVEGEIWGVSLRKSPGDPAVGELVVAPNKNGEVEFDFQATRSNSEAQVLLRSAKIDRVVSLYSFYTLGWRGITTAGTFCDESGGPLASPLRPTWRFGDSDLYLMRPTNPETVASYLVERRRKTPSANWEQVEIFDLKIHRPAFPVKREWLEPDTTLGDFEWRITSGLSEPP